MLDKTLHKHLDVMDGMEAKIDAEIDAIMSKIDIDEVINDPEGVMLAVVEAVKEDIVDQMAEDALVAGEDLAKAIEKKDEIIVDESNNPNKNAELVK